jgi:hypothetical protein
MIIHKENGIPKGVGHDLRIRIQKQNVTPPAISQHLIIRRSKTPIFLIHDEMNQRKAVPDDFSDTIVGGIVHHEYFLLDIRYQDRIQAGCNQIGRVIRDNNN